MHTRRLEKPMCTGPTSNSSFESATARITTVTASERRLLLEWKKRSHWDAPHESAKTTPCPYDKLHLYDGGVYDNLGLEPFFDACHSTPKIENSALLVSDASAPYKKGVSYFAFNPWRMKRMMDLMSDGHIKRSVKGCTYIWIQEEIDGSIKKEDKDHACNHPTSLRKLSNSDFEKISSHGYAIAKSKIQDNKLK